MTGFTVLLSFTESSNRL